MDISRRSFMTLSGVATSALATGALTTLLHLPTQAAAPFVNTTQPGFVRKKIGDFEVTALLDGYFDVNPDLIVGYNEQEAKKLLRESYLPEEQPIRIPASAYLINTGKELVLIDAGTANAFGDTLGHLPAALLASGYKPEQVDKIVITHMHPDHLFGVLDAEGNKVFPNAELILPEVDYTFIYDDKSIGLFQRKWFSGLEKLRMPIKTSNHNWLIKKK